MLRVYGRIVNVPVKLSRSLATKEEILYRPVMASIRELKNYINGEFVGCASHVDSYNPATGEVHLKIPDSGDVEVQAAVEASQNALKK